ncbi:cytochrome P450 [Methylobacterium sp. Leaf104]|uniref:cytochrome P450 n=1 Tax=Methylobacterium TaxID=407 RepID=UPI0007009A6F|nr:MULTISPECIES: cytochrome P450 [Methylobacterium]KQP41550.1 cytochrome P450 [Methylobacterium sp. Leaf104]MCI9881597.1 cytochrome P450 [Methylobacterium goesingense]
MSRLAASNPDRVVPARPEPPETDLGFLPSLRALSTNAIGIWPRRTYDEPISHRPFLGRTRFVVNDPDAIRHVLVDNHENYLRTRTLTRILRPLVGDGLFLSEGAAWRRQRRILAPAFTPRAVEALLPNIHAAVDEALDDLAGQAARGPVDLFTALQHLAIEIAGRTMFSVDLRPHAARLRHLLTRYNARLGRPYLLDFLLPLPWPSPHDLLRARFRRHWFPVLDAIIAARTAQPRDDGPARDLLDLLMAVRDPETGQGLTPVELRDQVATMILAGHETTAVALFWAAYLLMLAPGLQARVAGEAAPLTLTRAVLDEVLRLYPPAFMITRRAGGPDTVGGHAVAAGDLVIVAPWVLHRHRRLWRDPDAFDPGRFLPGAAPVPRFAYLPFGAGPRICIGAQFALLEATQALSRLVRRFRLGLSGDRPVLPSAVVTTQPDHAPRFHLQPRG